MHSAPERPSPNSTATHTIHRNPSPQLAEWSKLLFKRFSNEVGPVHLGMHAGFVHQGMARVITIDGQAVSSALVRPRLASDGRCVAIVAAAVPTDLQRLHIGLQLLQSIDADHRGEDKFLQACCRAGLASNKFWAAAGFTAVALRLTNARRGKPLIMWRRCSGRAVSNWWEYVPPRKPRGAGGLFVPAGRPDLQEQIVTDRAAIFDVLRGEGITANDADFATRPWPLPGHLPERPTGSPL